MKPCVVTSITRPEPALADSVAKQGVATIHEVMNKTGLFDSAMRPIKEGWSVCGPAVTSLNHIGDNLMVHAALDICQPGDFLVITTTAPCTSGMVGELIARQALERGVVGLIVEAGVRDVADLRKLGLPIWSKAISASGAVKATPGWVNVPVTCGGVAIHPGDLIVADDDGVVVVPYQEADRVLELATSRTEREAETRARIEAGELTFDLHNLRQFLHQRGVPYVTDSDELRREMPKPKSM